MEILENEQQVYDKLDSLGIEYKLIEHEPLFTAEDMDKIADRAPGIQCKNLFLRNAKGNKYYLITAEHNAEIDMTDIREKLGSTRLSFGSPERLMKVLKLEPGSVNPFSLINDTNKEVQFFLDRSLITDQQLNFHPNVNYKTVNISLEGLKKYLASIGVIVNLIDL